MKFSSETKDYPAILIFLRKTLSDQKQEESDIQDELNDSDEDTADEITRPLGKLFLEINDKIERIQGQEETTTRTSVRNKPSLETSIDNIEVPLPSFEVNLSGEEDAFLLTKGDIVSNFKNRFFSNEIIEENYARDGKALADEITHDNWIDPTDARQTRC